MTHRILTIGLLACSAPGYNALGCGAIDDSVGAPRALLAFGATRLDLTWAGKIGDYPVVFAGTIEALEWAK